MPGSTPTVRAVASVDPSRTAGNRLHSSLHESRAALRARLEARREEIEQAIVARVYAIADPSEAKDFDYVEGLRTALTVALDYGLEVIERGEERAPAIPPTLLAQARMAARNGVGLDIVVRRYVAGYSLLSEFAIGEAGKGDLLRGTTLQRVLRGQAAILDRLVAAVTEEYGRESSGRLSSAEQRRARRVERLLAGELLDASDLAYDLEGHHLGAIAKGPGAIEALQGLAASSAARLLSIRREEGIVWAWFGSRRQPDATDLERLSTSTLPPQTSLALGEPAQGLHGWRLTHRQARAALPIACRSNQGVVRYGDAALLASILQDDLLATSLRELYLKPLERERDGGAVLRETLRAYFGTGRNISSTAMRLGIDRKTVAARLRTIEQRLGRSLTTCAAELESALHLQEMRDVGAATSLIPPTQ